MADLIDRQAAIGGMTFEESVKALQSVFVDHNGTETNVGMKMISADRLLEDLRKVYEKAGWDPRECHFSLLDMECNIDGQYGMERVTISTSEVVPKDKLAYLPEEFIAKHVYDGFAMKLGKEVMAFAKMKEEDVPLLKSKVYSAGIDVLRPLYFHEFYFDSSSVEENQK